MTIGAHALGDVTGANTLCVRQGAGVTVAIVSDSVNAELTFDKHVAGNYKTNGSWFAVVTRRVVPEMSNCKTWKRKLGWIGRCDDAPISRSSVNF